MTERTGGGVNEQISQNERGPENGVERLSKFGKLVDDLKEPEARPQNAVECLQSLYVFVSFDFACECQSAGESI